MLSKTLKTFLKKLIKKQSLHLLKNPDGWWPMNDPKVFGTISVNSFTNSNQNTRQETWKDSNKIK